MPTDLEQLGLEAARELAGQDAVTNVDVQPAVDSSDRPAYRFSYLIDWERRPERIGLFRIRLLQSLHDRLEARGDDHVPRVVLLDHAGWNRRMHA